MPHQPSDRCDRREFLTGLGMAVSAALFAWSSGSAAEPPPETNRIRIPQIPSAGRSPEWIAEELLRAEGFSDVQYNAVQGTRGVEQAWASGAADIAGHFAAPVILRLEAGDPIVIVGGEHVGCFELLGSQRIRTIRDLKGRAVAIPALDPAPYAFLASMAAYVGLDPRKDITWVEHRPGEAMQLLAEGKIDAYLGFPTDPQELRAKKNRPGGGQQRSRSTLVPVLLLHAGRQQEIRAQAPCSYEARYPSNLESAEICAVAPERVAKSVTDKGLSKNYGYALEAIKSLPYGRWREYDAEDTVRFWGAASA